MREVREVGLPGQRAQAGELGQVEADHVVALGAGLANTSSCLLGADGGVAGPGAAWRAARAGGSGHDGGRRHGEGSRCYHPGPSRAPVHGRFSLKNQALARAEPAPLPALPDAPQPDQALRLQVLRRTDHLPAARPAGRRGRPERLRQDQHHGRGALGARREQGQRTARRVDAGRDLQRLGPAQAGQPRQRGAGVRQPRRARRRAVEPVRRDRGQARAHARRQQQLLHQQPAGAPPRRAGRVPGHRPRPARLRHHRPGHDQPHHRIAPRGAAPVPRRSRRRVEVQGTPPRDREPAEGHAREPDARRRHPARAERQPRQAARRRPRSPGATARCRSRAR